jgi:adenylate cyclase
MTELEPQFEVERRFLVNDRSVVDGAPWELITQAYVFAIDGFAVRVRLVKDTSTDRSSERAWLTGKGPRFGAQREEYEVEVPVSWARQVIDRSSSVVRKRRYQMITDQAWDVDEFLDTNEGLWIAELEGGSEVLGVPNPTWAQREIRGDDRLDNESLALRPISTWSHEDRASIGLGD